MTTPSSTRLVRLLAGAAAILYTAFLCWLYYPALFIFFASDDWVLIYNLKNIPPTEPWRYFSPHTIWFYRPLQSMQYALTYHAFGLNHVAFNVQLIVMYLSVSALSWVFLRIMFGFGIATIAVVLFSVSGLTPDVLLWKGGFNTMQNAIITLSACCFYIKYLKTRQRTWFYATALAAVANWFSKESGINLPLILGSVWLTHYMQDRWQTSNNATSTVIKSPQTLSLKIFLREGFRDLWVFGVLALTYVVLHRVFFKNVNTSYQIAYPFVSPVQAIMQLARGTNNTLFNFLYNPILLDQIPGIRSMLATALITHGYVLPLAIIAIGYFRKNAAVFFSLLLVIAAQVPTFSLELYYESRYYYLAAIGGSTFIAGCLWPAIKSISTGSTKNHNIESVSSKGIFRRTAACCAIIFLLWFFLGSMINLQQQVTAITSESIQVEKAFSYLKNAGRKLPQDSFILINNVSDKFLYNGMGAQEMVWMAVERNDIRGMYEPDLEVTSSPALDSWPHLYTLDVASTRPLFKKLR